MDDGHTYGRGLTKTLSSCFYPEFSISVTLKDVKKKPRKRGMHIGNMVDKQLTDWVETGKVRHPDKRFLLLVQIITNMGWTPIKSQLALGCSTLRLGTRVDLICKTKSNKLVIVELKCGFDEYYDVGNQGNMSFPFQDVVATFRNKHYIQLWITCWLFKHSNHRWNKEDITSAYVLRLYNNEKDTLTFELNSLPNWMVADRTRLKKCLEVLKRTRHETSKKRTHNLANGSQRSRRKFKK